MSGGVDSSVAAALLLKEGHTVEGVTFVTEPSEADSVAVCDAAESARFLGIPHRVLDISKEFDEKVKKYFVSAYESGLTPNPCVVCNREIKFGIVSRYAECEGFDAVATGHYARLRHENGRIYLYCGADMRKDQAYMLSAVPEESLRNAIFPLGDLTKDEIRRIAEDLGITTAHKKDSQDICFVPDGAYARFIWDHTGHKPEAGDFIDMDGCILGRHGGIECYTIGQRKGIGISGRHPYYVVAKNADRNTVMLGEDEDLFRDELYADDLNWIAFESLTEPVRCAARTRYHQAETPCTVYPQGDRVRVKFDTPIRAITAGQAVVFYDGDIVVGGGCIL